jgi:minimal CRISPR polymerase domain
MFLFYDGDNIKNIFYNIYKSDDLAKLKLISSTLRSIHQGIELSIFEFNSDNYVIEQGGDEGSLFISKDIDVVAEMVKKTWDENGLMVSIGLGKSLSEAFNKCQKSKA